MNIKVADEIWVSAALLHREKLSEIDFSVSEIVGRALEEGIFGSYRPGLQAHASTHCVANKRPHSGRYRMLYETARGRRRLFRAGDPYHPHREGARIRPEKGDLPSAYGQLIDWYDQAYDRRVVTPGHSEKKRFEVRLDLSELQKWLECMSPEELREQLLSVCVRRTREEGNEEKQQQGAKQKGENK
jgi:hypothetical protein